MICNKSICTGCFACYNICPKKAINMVEDSNGFIYPSIDKTKCINCGLCKRVCPAINKIPSNYPLKCFAAQLKDKTKLNESTSGGAATIFSEIMLQEKGIVYGASYKTNGSVAHTRIANIEKLYKIKGSKYVHSYINDTFNMVKNDLNNNKKVLFIGTPCQIAGLKRYLTKDYDKLYTVDIICHGVPSQKYLKDELKSNNALETDYISFRNNTKYQLVAKSKSKVLLKKDLNDSVYCQGFMDGFFFRENCYSCKYAKNERISDITIGDFWGLSKESKLYSKSKNGISVLLPATKKGLELIDKAKTSVYIEKRPIVEAINGNSQLQKPTIKPTKYYKFKKDYENIGFKKAYIKNRKMKFIKNLLKKSKLITIIYHKLKRK